MPDLRGTACHAHELLGPWACEPQRLQEMVRIANGHTVEQIVRMGATHRASVPEPKAFGLPAPPKELAYDVNDGIATIDIGGPLTKYASSTQAMFGGTSMILARKAIRDAVASERVRGIMLRIDSPGGTVAGTSDFGDEISAASARKPVWAYIEDLGASAAYWAASSAERIIANRNALIGSIGVLSVLYDSSEQAEKLGVKVHVLKTGFAKGTGVAGAPVSEEQLEDWQRHVDSLFGLFRDQVMRTRRMTQSDFDTVGTGQMWVAEEARALRLIDDVSGFDAAVRELRMRASKPAK